MPTLCDLRWPCPAVVVLFLVAACGSGVGTNQQVSVAVVGAGTGSGTVVSPDPAVDINCTITTGATGASGCSDAFDDAGSGGTFDLVAAPSAGSVFTAWAGCSSNSNATCTLTFSEGPAVDFAVTATFTATAAACNNPLVIQDQFTSDAGWTSTVVVVGGSPTDAVTLQATGGNPGGYRQMQHIFPGDGEIYVYHYYGTTTYNPSVQGAIDHINYSEDQVVLAPPFAGADIGAGFVMNQASVPYLVVVPSTGPFSNTTWQTAQVPDIVAADFAGLNLSATGGEITFGYYRANTHIGGGALTLTHGIDNWKVEICR